MTEYEIASLHSLDQNLIQLQTITTYFQIAIYIVLIGISFYLAVWFVRSLVMRTVRSYLKFRLR